MYKPVIWYIWEPLQIIQIKTNTQTTIASYACIWDIVCIRDMLDTETKSKTANKKREN